ncbi:MAG: universal stress protein [Flavobacteriales bacterium]
MSKILTPTDFSPVSDVAIRYACEIAKSTHSSVHLLHIVDEDDGMQDEHIPVMILKRTMTCKNNHSIFAQ